MFERFARQLPPALFPVMLASLMSCDSTKTEASGAAASDTTARTLNVDAALADPVTVQYMTAATGSATCKALGEAVVAGGASFATSVTDVTSLNKAVAAFNAQLEALGTCVTAGGAKLPALPKLPEGQTSATSCVLIMHLGTPKTVGDCAKCQLAQKGSAASLSCTGQALAAPTDLEASAVDASGSGCSVQVVDGKLSQNGSCSGCQVTQTGSSASVSCGGTASMTLPSFSGLPTGDSTNNGAAASITRCAANLVGGQVVKTGNCDGCTVSQQAGGLQVMCASQSATGGQGQTTTPSPLVGSCQAMVVNGVMTQTGDCSKCTVKRDGNAVSVSCSDTGGGTVAVPDPSSGATTGACQAYVVNGVLTKTGDCSKCTIQQNGNAVSVSCSG